MSRSSRLLAVLFIGLFAVLMVLRFFQIYTDFLWFGELGQMAVIKAIWSTRVKLGLLVGVCFFAWLFANMRVARKLVPRDVTIIGQRLLPDAERAAIEQHIDKVLVLFALIGAILAGLTASAQWREWLKYFNAVPFGQTDPLLGMDVGFYIFKLPLLQYAWRTAFYAAVVAFVVVTLIHLYNEAIRVHGRSIQATLPAQIHCVSLLAWCFLLKGVGYWLARYALMYAPSVAVPGGPGYAAHHYRLPVFSVQIGACVVAALICLATFWVRNLRLPAFALAGVILLAFLGGVSYPALMEQLRVRPNAIQLEPPYIAHNIEATNRAYALDSVIAQPHAVDRNLSREDVQQNDLTIKNLRIWDDRPMQYTYRQQQALRQYYEFASVDVDRYLVGGKLRQVCVSARQLDYDLVSEAWPNRHLQFTHGYGLCMSPVNEVDAEGLPRYWLGEIPPQRFGEAVGEDPLRIDRAGLYYMENVAWDPYGYGQTPAPPPAPTGGPGGPEGTPAQEPTPPQHERRQTRRDVSPLQDLSRNDDYVIVNSGSGTPEIDYPVGREVGDTAKTEYAGEGGVPLRTLFRKIAFFVRFGFDWPILFYDLGPQTRIIYNRWVPDRIREIAPGLLLADPQPYPVIYEGRVVWIVDAYTAAQRYPYSTAYGPRGQAPNYVRNSVKATVDAYDGTVRLYVWDPTDPLIQAYRKMFPSLFLDKEEMPEGLRKHTRYPLSLFDLQTTIFTRYHVKDPVTFFQGEDAWAVPNETLSGDERPVEPYYVLMSLPDATQPEFMLIRPFTPVNRENLNMIAWMCARCDGDSYGELRLYTFDKSVLSYGPMQIEARIDQDEGLADYFKLKSETNRIIRGHLLVIPFGSSLMYLEPVYLESKKNPVPKLSLVVVASQDHIGYGGTLAEALGELFGGGVLTSADTFADGEPMAPEVVETQAPTGSIAELARELNQAWTEAEELRKSGDIAGWSERVKALGPRIEKLQKAVERGEPRPESTPQ